MSILPSAAIEPDSNPVVAAPRALASVLVIDDEEIICDTLSALLKAGGFEVVTALSGEEGAELLRGRQFEVAIADLVMPGMDGIQTIAALKEVDPDVEVIILTGYATVNSTIAALRQGACDFLLKPIGMAQLGPALMRALEKRRPKAALPMYEASRTLLATLNREDLIPAILTLAQRTMRASAVGLALVPPEGTGLRVALSDDHGPFTEAVAESIAQIAMQAGEALRDPSFQAGHFQSSDAGIPAGSVLTYHLEMRNTLLGALVLWRDQGMARFSAFDGERCKLLADEIVIALDNARLYRELSHKVEELETAKREVARAEACARAVMETAQEAIVLLDKEGAVWDLNPKGVEMLGTTRDQALGRDFADFAIPPRLLNVFTKHLETAYREGKDPLNGCLEVCALRQNGEEFPLEISTAVIETPQGKLLSTFARDITDRKKAEEALRVSENRYRLLFERNLAGVLRCTREGRILDCNESLARMLGYDSPQELLGTDFRELWDDPSGREKMIARLSEHGSLSNYEVHFRRLDGKPIWALLNLHQTRPEGGEAPILEGTFVDITQRKQAEEGLLLAQFSIEHASDAIAWLDFNGRIVYVNEAACRSFGRTREELLSLKIAHIDPDFSPGAWEVAWERVKAAGSITFEARHITKLGQVFPVEVTANYAEFGGKEYSFTFSRDIAQRKEAERQINLQITALKAAANGIVITDQKGQILWANPAFTRLTGYPATEVIGQNPRVLKSGAHDAAFYQKLWNTVSAGEVWQGEIINRRKDGTLYTEEMTITPVRDLGGDITHFIAVQQDITERKRAEASMAERHRLATLVAEVGVALTGAETLRQGLQQCAEILVRDIDAAFARVWTVNEEERVLELQASAGMYTHIDGGHARVPIGKFKIGRIAENGEPHLTNSVQEDSWVGDPEWARREGMVAFAGYPLKVEERVLGVVAAFARKPLTEATLQAFASVADNIAQFIRRKRAEEALRESEERYRLLFERNLAGVFRGMLLSRRVLDCNDAYARILGYDSRQEVLKGGKLHAFYDPTESEIVKTRLLKEKALTNFEVRICHKDQAPVWVLENVSLIEARKGEEPLVEGTIFDITQRKQAEQALAHERDLLRALMDNVPDYIYFKDRESRFVLTSMAHAKAFGLKDPAEVVGKTDFDFFASQHAQQAYDDEQEMIKTGNPMAAKEEKETWPDGRVTWVSTTKMPFLDASGNIVGTFGVSRDITERTRAEEALRDSEEKFRVLYESSCDAIMMLAPPDWAFIAGNPAAIALFGARDEQELVAAARWTLSPEYQPDGVLSSVKAPQMIDAAMKTGSNFFEWTHKKFSGEEFLATVALTRMIYRGQTLLQATVRDITEHKRAQDELHQSRQMLQTILDTIPQRVFWKDRNLIYLGCNRALALDAGVQDPAEIIGRTDFDLSWGGTAEVYRADDRLVMEQESAKLNYEEILSRPDGSLMWLRTSKLPLRDHEGRVIGVIGTYEDVTERKRAEEELLFKTALLEAQSETTIDGILVVDPTGQVLLANRQFARMLDVPEEAIRTKEDKKLIERALTQLKDPDAFLERMNYLYAHETEKTRDEIEFKDGRVFDRYSSPLQDSTGKLHGRIWYFRDITERKQAEEEVRESNELVRLLLDSIPEAVYGIDMEGNCTFCNPSCLRLLGCQEAADLHGKNMHDLIHHTRLDGTPNPVEECHIYEAFRRGHGTHIDDEVLWRRDGSNFPAECWSRPIHRYGNVIGTVVTFVDITERKRVEEALRDSEEKHRVLYESSRDAIMMTAPPEWKFTAGNPAAVALFGARDEREFVAAAPWSLSPEYQPDGELSSVKARQMMEAAMERGSNFFEWTHKKFSGEEFFATVALTKMTYRGQPFLQATVRDITERKEVEEKLQESETKYRSLVSNIPDVIWTVDSELQFAFVSPNIERLSGFSLEEVYRCGAALFLESIHTEDVGRAGKALEALFARGEPYDVECRVRRKDGEWIWVHDRAVATYEKNGVRYADGLLSDITPSKRAEETLRASEERYRELFENASDIVYTTDLDTRLTSLNRAGQQTLGYSAEEATQLTLSQLVAPKHWEIVKQGRDRLLAGESDLTSEVEVTTKDGRQIMLEVSPRLIYKDGKPVGVQAIARDITGRDVAEMELRHTQKLESVGRLASGIAHEINTPIQFVGDNTRFLQESFESFQSLLSKYQELRSAFASGTASPEFLAEVQRLEEESDCAFLMAEVPQAISQTLEGVERVATIVRAMKEFAHPESRQMAATDLNRALQSTLTVARNELKYVADVETAFGELPLVVCNVGDLNQVFLNLLVNAAHAIGDVVKGTFAKGKIGVRTQAEGNTVLVTISDTGCGIPIANRSKVFDPFFTTKEVGRGTGQGLAISRSVVVDRHKGTLSFDSEVGKGTTFYIRLPVDPAECSQEMKAP